MTPPDRGAQLAQLAQLWLLALFEGAGCVALSLTARGQRD